jgi:DNA-binding CsgD family transcriptional regulator
VVGRASAQALAFVARRLLADSVALIVATREPGGEFRGLPELVVGGLGDGDSRALLSSVIRGPLDERVRDRIVAETRGNPLALLELPRGLSPAELAGGFGLLDVPGQIEDSFRRRFEALPAAAQQLLLVAAAEPAGDPLLVWRAAGRLGIGVTAAAAAEADGLVAIGARVTFRHPLVRSAVYRAASAQERLAVHRALADATDPQADPDRRAWHRAQAALGPDEEVAAELERSAGRAQARGGLAAAAAFLERSAALTLELARRVERALAAAQAKYQAGAFEAALGLLAATEAEPLDELQRARADLLRAQIAFALSPGNDAPPLFLKAAKRLELLDVRLARETYLDALAAALFAGRLASAGGLLEVAEAARAAHASPQPERGPDLLLEGLARLSETTRASGTDWALGIEARSRALLSDGEAAETFYHQAIEALGRLRVDLARARLLYGEWLRRQRRRIEARKQLRAAHELFAHLDMEAFAERARIELRATGEHARKRTAQTRDALTAQEALIARLAGGGASNPEIAAQLFISPATVAYHLQKVFAKLGISSGNQLARALPPPPDPTRPDTPPS